MKGYEKLTAKRLKGQGLYIPLDILPKYTDDKLIKALEFGMNVCVILEDKTLVPIKKYKGW